MGATTQPLDDLDSESLLDGALSEDMLDSISIIDTAAALDDEPVVSESEMKADPIAQKHEAEVETFDIGSLDFDLGTPDIETSTTVAPSTPAVAEIEPPMLPVEETSSGLVDESAVTVNDANDIDFNSIDFDLGDAAVHLDEDKTGASSIGKIAAGLQGWKRGETIYVTNSLPYAKRLEYDAWSKQATAGMVRISVMEFKANVKKQAASL